MNEFFWIVVSLVVGLVAGAWLGRSKILRPERSPAESGVEPPSHGLIPEADPVAQPDSAPAVEAATPSPSSLAGKLQALVRELDAAVESSAHPADLLEVEVFRKATGLLRSPEVSLDAALQYGLATNVGLACATFEAIAGRQDAAAARTRLLGSIASFGVWQLYFALRALLAGEPRAAMGIPLARVQEWWPSQPVAISVIREYLIAAQAQGGEVGFGDALEKSTPEDLEGLTKILAAVEHPVSAQLERALGEWRKRSLNRKALLEFGQFIDPDVDAEVLCEFMALAEPLTLSESGLLGNPPRSVLVIGEARSGKSTLIRLLAVRLKQQGYAVFQAGAAELMAGQQYIGQLEQRVQMVLRELAIGKRVVWWVPDLLQLASAGVHRGQSASVLDQIVPAIAAGQIVFISEATPAQWTRLMRHQPSLRSTLQLTRLRPLTDGEIAEITKVYAARLEQSLGLAIPPDVSALALRLARQYLGAQQSVGGVFDFLKLACTRAVAADEASLGRQGLLETLSQATGLPRAILDDGDRVDLAALRKFFASRVIGQATAVDAVVERIAMLKAGLTDPGRPIGVFLLAGPTGTGKTELAKSLAEYLFGSGERMIRLDMSEFQSAESTRKIIGEPGEGGESESLTQRVRKQPFCVVLLDEFEKAHPNTWDLFLQVFDDGRLTDANGHTVDFRHAFVILTANLGATAHKGSSVGFVQGMTSFADAQVLRAVQQSFRPEFVNRLDRVLVFQPLSRDLMRDILRKELRRILERRGLKDREWAVEWEASALEFLLDKGFSPDMGARPLRRAIDQYLLAPLAATLVEHRFPEGEQFLFVRSDGRALQVDFVDPDEDFTPTRDTPAAQGAATAASLPVGSLALTMVQANGTTSERSFLQSRIQAARRTLESPRFEQTRDELAAAMRQQDFWTLGSRFAVLARYALLDRLRAAVDTAASLEGRLQRSLRAGSHSRPLAARLALQLYLVELGLADAAEGRVTDVVLSVTPVLEGGGTRVESDAWCSRLLDMYRNWGNRRHMQVEEFRLADCAVLVIGGFGAWQVLGREAGLHVLEHDLDGGARVAARVRIAGEEPEDPARAAARESALARLIGSAPSSNDVVRRYRDGAAPLVRDARAGWRTGHLDLVLGGDFDVAGVAAAD